MPSGARDVLIPRRLKRQQGRYGLVDGIPFALPVSSERRARSWRRSRSTPTGRAAAGGQRGASGAAPAARTARRHRGRLPGDRHRPVHRVLRSRSPARTGSRRRRLLPVLLRRASARAVRRRPARHHRGLGEGRQGHLGHAQAPGEPRLRRRRRHASAASTTSTASSVCASRSTGRTVRRPAGGSPRRTTACSAAC